jgi:carbonic anhydrase/acetyltransferase-like protein (isoleucine patch superfamily)
MPDVIPYGGTIPRVHESVFLATNATVIGDVEIGEGSSVWFGTVIRGDVHSIRIGKNTNVQDLSVIHVTTPESGKPATTTIGDHVTIGHRVILHGCTIDDCALVGMGSIVMDGAVVGKNSVIGAGSLVTEGTVIPEGHLALGSPAKVKRPLTEAEILGLALSAEHYRELASRYRDTLR